MGGGEAARRKVNAAEALDLVLGPRDVADATRLRLIE